jgi:exodeoxyribonuclease VII small subunit
MSIDRSTTGPGPAEDEQDDTPRSYEDARDELAAVVAKLEAGGLSLDESLTLWERGEALAALCGTFLDGARERVEAALRTAEQQ